MSSAKLNYPLAGNLLDLTNAESAGYSQYVEYSAKLEGV
jgi:hypothetical protein